jgi:hypothetical protein
MEIKSELTAEEAVAKVLMAARDPDLDIDLPATPPTTTTTTTTTKTTATKTTAAELR